MLLHVPKMGRMQLFISTSVSLSLWLGYRLVFTGRMGIMLWTCLSSILQGIAAVVVQDMLMRSNICELDEGGKLENIQSVKQLNSWACGVRGLI